MVDESQQTVRARSKRPGVRRRAWRAIMEMHGAITPLLDEELRNEAGIDLQTYDALLHVYEAGKVGIPMTELAQKVVLSKSGLTTLVDRIEERGWMQRIPDSVDRRVTRITLTDPGVEAFRSAARIHVAGIESYFASRVTDDEAEVIVETLERMCRGIPPDRSDQ